MTKKLLLDASLIEFITTRICHQIVENHPDIDNCVILGLQPRGVYFADKIKKGLKKQKINLPIGYLDPTFHRDDFRRGNQTLKPRVNQVPFLIEDKNVILVDDVLFSGRTVRAALDAMIAFGRPKQVELAVLIDRKYTRQLPIEADYVGQPVDSLLSQRVLVEWKVNGAKNDAVYLIKEKNE